MMREPPIAAHVETHASVSSAVGRQAESGGGTLTPSWQPCEPTIVAML